MVGPYTPKLLEPDVLAYWKKNSIYEKAKAKGKGGKKFYFLQGPPYTTGRIHIGTAWNECLKDMALRYRRMAGYNVYDRHGYDMHGLPISRKVMAEHNLRFKEDIEKFGVEKFINECTKFALNYVEIMNNDFKNLGIWLDFDNAYMPVKNEYIEGVWWLVKRAHEENRLYKGSRALSWCADCSTALAKHELQYKKITDTSIFVKLKVLGVANEYLIVWTTTPWTIAFNLAVMVNPELDYVRVKVEDEIWIIAKSLAPSIILTMIKKEMTVIEEMKGQVLQGLKYEHPWSAQIPFASLTGNPDALHSVLMSKEYVHLTAGSGLVHCAPGCGPEDYEIGHRNHLPPFNEIDEKGIFGANMGKFSGKRAKLDDRFFVQALAESGNLVASTSVTHDYAHCERCHNPIVFRATEQWFFKTEDLKANMMEANKDVTWVPKNGGDRFNAWLENLRDNSITKQIHWGTPVPIWVNIEDDTDFIVIGSQLELRKLGATVPENLHKPWIDDVTIHKEGKTYKRIPDILDVWIDAGSASWLALDYPARKDLLEEWYPADLILEASEQVRLWFNMLMVASIIALKRPAFKAVYMHGMLLDIDGEKMSKSLGNILSPDEVIEKHSVDTLRYYLLATNAGQDINFAWDELSLRHRNLIVLWNVHNFVIDYAQELNVNPTELNSSLLDLCQVEEEYILSLTHSTIQSVTQAFDTFQLDAIPGKIELLFFELSRTYIQYIRDKSTQGTEKEKHIVLFTLHLVLRTILQLLAPVCPHITEQMFLNLRSAFGYKEESIHLLNWPTYDPDFIKYELENDVGIAKEVIQACLSARERAKIGVRWPLKALYLQSKCASQLKKFHPIIKKQVNVKTIIVNEHIPQISYDVKVTLGGDFGAITPHLTAHLHEVDASLLLNDITTNGKYECSIRGQQCKVYSRHVLITTKVNEPFVMADFPHGTVFITKESDTDLENEGFAREIMRRIQGIRKKAGLQRGDSIELHLQVDTRLKSVMEEWAGPIKEKVGSSKLIISTQKPDKVYDNSSDESIKGQTFSINLTKI